MRGVLLWILGLGMGGWQTAVAQPGNYTCIWHTTGLQTNSKLGRGLVSAGDINHDGYDDILAMAWGEKKVYLYYGGNPMDTIPDIVFSEHAGPYDQYTYLPKECRDLNNDGYNDIAIGGINIELGGSCVYVYFGRPDLDDEYDMIFLHNAGAYGQDLSMGDINGDGISDLVVGAKNSVTDGFGKIFVYYGGADFDTIPDFTISGASIGIDLLGEDISCGGDVNNDGFDDIATHANSESSADGEILFFGGNPPDSIPDWEKCSSGGYFTGIGLNIIPDINNDGFDEIIYSYIDENSARLHYGGNVININYDVELIGNTWYPTNCGDYVGDINADGYADYATGSVTAESYCVFFLGPNLGNIHSFDLEFEGSNYAIAPITGAGDVNGDGVDDLLFGSLDWDNPDPGQIFIYSDTSLSYLVTNVSLSIPGFKLNPCYPNPFNSSINIPFEVNKEGEITLKIYNNLGRQVQDLGLGIGDLGVNTVVWNAGGLSSGTYLVELHSGDFRQARKVVLVK